MRFRPSSSPSRKNILITYWWTESRNMFLTDDGDIVKIFHDREHPEKIVERKVRHEYTYYSCFQISVPLNFRPSLEIK